jgi:plasmid replication initiation protein
MQDTKIIASRSENIIEARYSLSTKQNNVLDMLFSELNEDENLEYVLNIEKYSKFIMTDTSNIYRDLKTAVNSFKGKGIHITDKDTQEEIYFPWFSKIHYKPKQGKILIKIDSDLKKILYEVKKKIYYDIKHTLNMKSNYSQRFYYYLKSYEDTGWRIDKIETLLKKMECPKSCENFARFKESVLDKAFDEINNNTDISFTYETIKEGRKIAYIKSYIKSKKKLIQNNYTLMSVEYILGTIGDLIDGVSDANKILKAMENENRKNDFVFFTQQVERIVKYHNKNKNIPFIALLLSAIKKPWVENNNTEQLSFNNFESRDIYNNPQQMKSLEEKLLGWDKDDEVAIDVESK